MIPYPNEVKLRQDKILLPTRFEISIPQSMVELNLTVERFLGFYNEVIKPGAIRLCDRPLNLRFVQMQRLAASHKDMHLISIEPQEILISAKSMDGFRYGLATLKQLIKLAFKENFGKLSCGQIIDFPAFSYRGLHLDESRHFFGVQTVKKYLDYMADYKLNHFHWHLSDDQGWRVESKQYPEIAEISAWRIEEDGSFYGGLYTHEQVKELLAYAESLGITVVPEFDLPGHTLALLAAYPDLACHKDIYQVANTWGIFDDVLCPSKPATMAFVQNLLAEYAALFPGPYFHIGGDEVPKIRWAACPDCNQKLRELKLDTFEQLQAWFTNELYKSLGEHGKELIAWDEVLDAPVNPEIIAMLWRGDAMESARLALANGNRYILSPNKISYLDWKADELSPGAHGVSNLENVYSLCPLNYPGSQLCLGLQANLWTEHIKDEEALFKQLHPRALALAERAWNPGLDYLFFLERLIALE